VGVALCEVVHACLDFLITVFCAIGGFLGSSCRNHVAMN
jgi:hypothetical protein